MTTVALVEAAPLLMVKAPAVGAVVLPACGLALAVAPAEALPAF